MVGLDDFGNSLLQLGAASNGANSLASFNQDQALTDQTRASTENQQIQNKQNQGILAFLADQRAKGVTDPRQILSGLAAYSPDIAAKMYDTQVKNPMAAAFSSFTSSNPTQGASGTGGNATQPTGSSTQVQDDPFILKPEGPDDKRNYQFLNTQVPPQYRNLLRQASNGDESVGNMDSLRSNGLLVPLSIFDPSVSKTDFAARQATAKAFSPAGDTGKSLIAGNAATQHMAKLAIDSLKLKNVPNNIENYIGNTYSKTGGSDQVTNYDTDVGRVAPEVAKVISGNPVATDTATAEASSPFNHNYSNEQMLGALSTTVDQMQKKISEQSNSYKAAMGGHKPLPNPITPENQQVQADIKTLYSEQKNKGTWETPTGQAAYARLQKVSDDVTAQQTPQGQSASPAGGDVTSQIAKAKSAGYSDAEIQAYLAKKK